MKQYKVKLKQKFGTRTTETTCSIPEESTLKAMTEVLQLFGDAKADSISIVGFLNERK